MNFLINLNLRNIKQVFYKYIIIHGEKYDCTMHN